MVDKVAEVNNNSVQIPNKTKNADAQSPQLYSIFSETNYSGGTRLAPYVATASAVTAFTGGAAIFTEALLRDSIKNPTAQAIFKNLPTVGKAMAAFGLIGLVTAFIFDNTLPRTKQTSVEIVPYKFPTGNKIEKNDEAGELQKAIVVDNPEELKEGSGEGEGQAA